MDFLDDTHFHCPVCRATLEISEDKKVYETLDEHVSDPNGELPARHYLLCPNETCIANERKVFWDWYGDVYTKGFFRFSDHCIQKIDSPFGSFSRQSAIEIYKIGLKDKTHLSPWLTFRLIQLYIEYHYKANTDGDVLSRRWTIGFLNYDKRGKRFAFVGHWWYSTLKFLWRRFHSRGKKDFKQSYNRDFIYRAFEFVVKILYRKEYLKSLEPKAKRKRK